MRRFRLACQRGFGLLVAAAAAAALLCPEPAHAQTESGPHSDVGTYARITSSGLNLPPGRLWDATEDQRGYLWLASEAGLMFDGGASEALTVDTEPIDPSDVNGATTSVTASDDGALWYADGTLKYINAWTNERSDSGVPADTVVDGPGTNKWTISGLEQVRLIDTEDGSIVTEAVIELDHAGRRTNPAASAQDGTLYVGGGSTIVEVRPDGATRRFAVTSDVAAVATANGGAVLYSTLSGLWRLAPELPRPELISELPGPSRGVLPTTALAQLADGTVLVGLGGGGLGVFDPTTASWGDADAEPLTDSIIDLIFEQTNGTVWLATDRGDLLHYHAAAQFGTIALPSDGIPNGLAQVGGALWAALGPDGVARYDEIARRWRQPISFEKAIEKLEETPNVTAIAEFEGDLWIATRNEGMLTVAGSTNQAELTQGLTNQTADLFVDRDRLFAVSSQKTQIMGLDSEGRVAWDLDWRAPQNRGRAAIASASKGLVYLVSHAGLGVFDSTDPSDSPIRSFDDLEWAPWANAIYVQDDEVAWIGTEVGLVRVDLNSGRTDRFTTRNGLPSATVTALLPSSDKTALWVGTNSGLSLLDLASETVLGNFGTGDGLPDNAVRPIRSAIADDGTGFLVTSDGIAVVPAEVPHVEQEAPSFAVRCRSGCGDRPSSELLRNPDRLTVDIVSPDGGASRLMPIEYRLDAPAGDWEHLPAGARTVSLGSLQPGTHSLEVRPANFNANGSSQPSWTVMTIAVDQVWWRRGRVQLAIIVGIVAAGAAVFWLRDTQRRAHARDLEQTIAARTRELEASRADAERANQAKNRFLMTVSHDLRSPLSGIVGFTELIASTELDDRQRRYNEGVARSASHLAELVEDLLYQSANATLATDDPAEPEPTLISDVVREAIEFVSAGATANEIELTANCQGCERPVLVDARGLKYVLANLLSNAINYSGGTEVHLQVIAKPDQIIEFSLIDNGGNLSPADAERVFEPGFRGHSVGVAGTGLGLSICQDWVVARGGRITVAVEPEMVTVFTFELKLEQAPTDGVQVDLERSLPASTTTHPFPSPRETPSTASEPRVVMVVEDDELVRDVLVTMLDGIGCQVWAFDCAKTALDDLSGRKWDLIFTDVMMQPTSGIEFARAVRTQMGKTSPPVAAITGVPQEAMQADVFDAVVNKPVVVGDLQRIIDRF